MELSIVCQVSALVPLIQQQVRGEGNSVIFINRDILPGPGDARICFTFC